jgi:hypothetical protein
MAAPMDEHVRCHVRYLLGCAHSLGGAIAGHRNSTDRGSP